MDNITPETKEALSVALNHVFNAGTIEAEVMALYTQFKAASGVDRMEILAKIKDLRHKVSDARLLLLLYLG